MRYLAALLATALAITAIAPSADAADQKKRRKAETQARQDSDRRPSTVDYRGLCQRDNGRPAASLNLNQRCDREEFFQRFNDFGGSRR